MEMRCGLDESVVEVTAQILGLDSIKTWDLDSGMPFNWLT